MAARRSLPSPPEFLQVAFDYTSHDPVHAMNPFDTRGHAEPLLPHFHSLFHEPPSERIPSEELFHMILSLMFDVENSGSDD